MKQIFTIVLLSIGLLTYSQNWDFEKPNYHKIEKNIQEKGSNLYYGSLMDRYIKSDTTMTLEEKRHLYYGYTFHEKYEPYSHSRFRDSLVVVLKKENLDSIDLKKIIKFTDFIISQSPFDLNAMNYQLYALEQTENKEKFEKRLTQLRIVLDALMSSGNGTSKKDAFYVTYTSHEYVLLNILGFEFGGMQSLIEHYDYLTVAKNKANIKGLYFDVTPCLNSMSKMFGEFED